MRSIENLIRKVRRNAEDYDWRVAAKRSLAGILVPIFERRVYRIYRIDLDHEGAALDFPASDPGHKAISGRAPEPNSTCSRPATALLAAEKEATAELTFRLLGQADDDQRQQIERYAEWLRGSLRDKIVSGSLCLAALDGREIAGFNLVSFGKVSIPPLRRSRVFHDGHAWSEHIAVFPRYRKRGLATDLRQRIFEHLRQRGARRLYGGTLRWNVPALKLARRLGFRELADGHYTRVLGYRCWSWTRVDHGNP